jgi:phosphotransferase system enzyme I (PtsP)
MSKRKDNVDLICDVAELAGMFEKTSSLSTFLDSTVSMVAWHMKAAVCSIYLIQEGRNELLLRATQGLNPDAVGKLKLDLGEGLTGLAVKELRTIRVARASSHGSYKHIPNLQEERYDAFLAVPIVRGLFRIGALVVQDPEPDYFSENDEKALKAIAGQLAATLENARLLINLTNEEVEKPNPVKTEMPSFIEGESTSKGIAIGAATVTARQAMDLSKIAATLDPKISRGRFEKALKDTEEELEELQITLGTDHEDIAELIFNAHLLMLKDESFSGKMMQLIDQGKSAADAVLDTVNIYVNLFAGSENPRLKEKVQDVLDLGHRLLLNLQPGDRLVHDYKNQIIIAVDLMPSDVVRFAVQRAEGIILLRRGITAHIAILARSMGIPMIQADSKQLIELKDGTPLIMDASQGTLFIDPDEEIRARYESLKDTKGDLLSISETVNEVTLTQDGVQVSVLANINLLSDLEVALTLKANGVGLYRSEFPFLIRDNFPTEEEQVRIYSRVLEKFPSSEVVFRTLDIGGDKLASSAQSTEENPFLGLRAIRFSLQHPEIFRLQIRALLRAGFDYNLKIMFPLVSSTDEFLAAKEFVQECIVELENGDVPFNSNPQLGIMIELPSAVELVNEMAKLADFLSIGSNDLTQYLLAVDRTNDQVSHMYLEHHPAVLRALNRIVEAGIKFDTRVSICGEMAARKEMIPFLLGIGLGKISVDPRSIPVVQAAVQAGTITEFRKDAKAMLAMGSVKEVEAFLETKA